MYYLKVKPFSIYKLVSQVLIGSLAVEASCQTKISYIQLYSQKTAIPTVANKFEKKKKKKKKKDKELVIRSGNCQEFV